MKSESSMMEVLKQRLEYLSSTFEFHQKFFNFLKRRCSLIIDSENEDEDGTDSNNEKRVDDSENKSEDDHQEDKGEEVVGKFEVGITSLVCAYNFHTLYNFFIDKIDLAKKYNEKALQETSDNFNALWNQAYLMVSDGESTEEEDTQIEKLVSNLENIITKDKTLMLIAKAEIAAVQPWLMWDQDALLDCVTKYEDVLSELRELSSKDSSELEDLSLLWKQDLVQNYARLTYGFKYEKSLTEASDIVRELHTKSAIPDKHKARAWVNLAVIVQHCVPRYERNFGYSSDILSQVPTSGYCYKKAMQLDPTNPKIFMQAGREQRKRAQTVSGLEEAVGWLEIALKGDGMENNKEYLIHHIGLANQRLWQLTDDPVYKDLDEHYHIRRNSDYEDGPTFGCLVIKPPHEPLDFSQIPVPYRKLPRNASWRFFNPIAQDPKNKYYLKAKQSFEEAVRIGEEKCLYLIDLARMHSSAPDLLKAGECLQEAMKEPFSEMVSPDSVGVSLYEYVGFHEETLMKQNGFDHKQTEKIKSFYRESIRQSTQNKWKPVVAFHHLLRILYKQLEVEDGFETETDRMIVQDEYFLLYMAIQEAKDTRDILESLVTSDIKIDLISRLIGTLHERDDEFDAEAAFTYFSILAVFKKSNKLTVNGELSDVKQKRLLLKLAERVTRKRIEQPRYFREEYQQLYDLIDSESDDSSSLDSDLSDLEKRELQIVRRIIFPRMAVGFVRTMEQC